MTIEEVLKFLGELADYHEITDVKNGHMITCFTKPGKGRKVAIAVWVRTA